MPDLKSDANREANLSPVKRTLFKSWVRGEFTNGSSIIPRQPSQSFVPLSFAQQRLWFIDQLKPGLVAYNNLTVRRLKGILDVAALELSFVELIRRHQVLRTTFAVVDEQPYQVIAPHMTFILPIVDLEGLSKTEQETKVRQIVAEEQQKPFDLVQDPPLRAQLLRLSDREHVFLLTIHHIASDVWSDSILARELTVLYQAFVSGTPSPLSELPVQYADFAVWQRQRLQGKVLEDHLIYWKQQLKGAPTVLELPTDHPRPPAQTFEGACLSFQLPKTLYEALKALSQQEGVTLYMTLLAAFKVLLLYYTRQTDILVGAPIAGRIRPEMEDMVGLFVNMLVFRTDLSGNPTFQELLRRVRKTALDAYARQELPFERLVEELSPERDLSHSPLFQVAFLLRDTRRHKPLEFSGVTMSPLDFEDKTAKNDLILELEEKLEGIEGMFNYSTDLFERATIARMAEHYQSLLDVVANHPTQRLSNLSMLTETERHLIGEWNATKIDYSQDRCIHQLFEAQVQRTPDAVAVTFEDEHLTYGELNQRANQLARYLRAQGVGAEILVGICINRSLEMIIGILGVLKAGGAYVPIDPAYPEERRAFMLEDTRVSVVLTQQAIVEQTKCRAHLIPLDTDWTLIAKDTKDNTENLTNEASADNLAYVIYTSGSTGKPKGVLVAHRGLCNVTQAHIQALGLQPDSRFPLFASLSFDAATCHIFITLCSGATLCLVNPDPRLLNSSLIQILREQSITCLILSTSVLETLPFEQFPKLKVIAQAGEVCSPELIERWGTGRRFFNHYGPTEASICSTRAECTNSGQAPPIGRPIANTQIYILDRRLQSAPIGIPGELCIGGAGVARGYLNRPGLTAEKFIPSPFDGEPGVRLYKTGDLARYLPDGNIEFLGRIDRQIKIRGFRIEPREIETVLKQHPAVQQAVVTACKDTLGVKSLAVYVVATPELALTITELRHFLGGKLPNYMVPSAFVMLDALPLTPNGKIDQRALPTPSDYRPELREAFVAPQTEIERTIAAVWQETLKMQEIGVNDNFFDLGGHSLLLISVHTALQKILNQDITLLELFKYPTVGSLAKRLSQEQVEQASMQQAYDRAELRRATASRRYAAKRKARRHERL